MTILTIILVSLISLLDRLKETTYMQNRMAILLNFLGIDYHICDYSLWSESKFGKWLISNKEDQLKQWYLWPVRDAFHAFKFVLYLSLIIILFIYLPFAMALLATLFFISIQMAFDVFLFNIIGR